MKRVTFRTEYAEPVHPIQAAVNDAVATTRADLLYWSPTADGTALVWFDANPAAVAEILDSVDTVTDVSLHDDTTGTYALIEQPHLKLRPAVLDVVSDTVVAFPPPTVFHGDGTVRFDAVGSSPALNDLHDRLQELTLVCVEAVREYRPWSSSSVLTNRQEEALAAAVAVGYYEIPREGAVSDVAEAIDCSHSTAGELLRKAERTVLTAVMDK
ncbi:helix-turn-helix domain-containing protein [Halostagnicola sp. A-GB9-2]|uniref:helix-turn-helix domain-containing protein n=1 Tax=Halostagnicola sp. A-GB9-2 TaxID=3048066 RepID=UPI0024C01C07|nr:helix-turn-helix domain-containing protein [Halostagnicola sp. A-GB9-2]MDJ1430471.1 helix-turn-helix domain-containing protein [Halostagnicola sp. A-GB9-2]